MKRFAEYICWGIFWLYVWGLFAVLFFGRTSDLEIPIKEYFSCYANLEPLKTLTRYIRYAFAKKNAESLLLAFLNIGGNFILFLPMGFFLPCLFRNLRSAARTFCVVAFIIFSSEIFQGVFRIGVPDIDDFLMNLSGALIGFLVAKLFRFCEGMLS